MNSVLPSRFHAAREAVAQAPTAAWHVATPPAPGLQAVVIIPAKDEAENLPATLAALAAQTTLDGQPLPPAFYEVLILANNCTDATAAVARRVAARWPHLTVHVGEVALPAAEAHVGKARRLLMDEACRRLEMSGNPIGFIASTDADTCVAANWLAATAAELAAGADAVGGRILMADPPAVPCPLRRCQLQDATYHLLRTRLESFLDPVATDPWPRHHQHFGASLALTTAAYRRVGGLPVVPYLEDEALCQALYHHDLRLRHSPCIRVYTSGRQQGRVAVGLSWQLRQWAELQECRQEPLVESPAQLVAEWQLRRQLRCLWEQTTAGLPEPHLLQAAALQLLIPVPTLHYQLKTSSTFGRLWSWVSQQQDTWAAHRPSTPKLPLSAAIAELRRLLGAYTQQSAVAISG